jgi:hypothetical protein
LGENHQFSGLLQLSLHIYPLSLPSPFITGSYPRGPQVPESSWWEHVCVLSSPTSYHCCAWTFGLVKCFTKSTKKTIVGISFGVSIGTTVDQMKPPWVSILPVSCNRKEGKLPSDVQRQPSSWLSCGRRSYRQDGLKEQQFRHWMSLQDGL